MISQKDRNNMIVEAAKAICESANGNWDEDSVHYTSDALAALNVFEPILRAEIEADYKAVQDELDRLMEENEDLTQQVEELKGLIP